jgi:beta-N-acetylhexosaminidase
MTVREQVGQLLLLGMDGCELGVVQAAWMRMLQPCGIVLFQRNIENAAQTRELLEAVQATTRAPMLRAVDLEGGQVDRLRDALAPMPSAGRIAALHSASFARQHGELIGAAARAFGFNCSFAPVLDLAAPESASVLGDRAAGETATAVVAYAKPFLQGLTATGVLGCGKHFPGLGGGDLDSHHALPRIRRNWKTLWAEDIAPYRELRQKLPLVMVSHAAYPKIGGNSEPASLSPFWIQKVLRQKIGFPGLVLSDDMEMKAIASRKIEIAALEFIEAGGDVFLICHDAAAITAAYEAVLKEAERSTSFRRKVVAAAQRVMQAKKRWARRLRGTSAPSEKELNELRAQISRLGERCA